ncbi:phosphorylcholine transferase LicD [Methanobrevibacter sp.]|uniref:LicD family protein n=1 Tax=Methanobrevibacter sp. TaxID=66852 RepID=UPI00386C0139
MNLSELYKKLPDPIQKSEKIFISSLKLTQFIRQNNQTGPKPNLTLTSSDMTSKGTLKDIQLVYLELLRFIDNVCAKYDLEYCLTYGTLLGAIRHKGFIPWDDDCDILMIRSDYDKLIEVLPKEINKHEFFKENCALTKLINKKDNFFTDFNNIYNEEIGHDEFFNTPGLGKSLFLQIGWIKPMVKLDIFPFDFIKPESINYYNKNYLYHKLYFRNLYNAKNFSYEKEFDKQFEKLGFSYLPTPFIAEGIDASFSDNFPPFKKELLFPTTTKEFEGYALKCPNKSEELLKIWYGNYMEIPQKVVIHEYVKYNKKLFESQEEMDKSFQKVINYLKEVNDNFE